MARFVIERPALEVDSCTILPLLRQAFMRKVDEQTCYGDGYDN